MPCPTGGIESVAVFSEWIRRCERCLTVDQREVWDDPVSAQSDAAQDERRRWYQRRNRWTCSACGWHDYAVDRLDPILRR